ncbi:MAG: aminotransferase [Chloroflexi bacterium]|nr:MAG: aminotransferase [Chloroflexota bacterium]MBA4375899.1 aldolase [Anaerolinea sp.]
MSQFLPFKQQIVDAAQKLTKKGYLMATGGNLSVRIAGQNAFAITPSNYDYLKMTADDVCVLDFDLNPLEGGRKPSVESGMHGAIYQTRADVNAVVHTHQVYASALALIRLPIPALFDEQTIFLGRRVAVIPYAPSGTARLKDTIARHVNDHNNAYLMQNHGALCFGHNLERAAHNVEILEKCALAYLLALCTGEKVSKIPLAARELAFAKLRKDQKKVELGEDGNGEE